MMKLSYLLPLALCLISQIAAAQNDINSAWGSTNIRYVHNEKPQDVIASALELTAWRGESVNDQFVVWNEDDTEHEVSFILSDLTDKQDSEISMENISTGYVETVITDKFADCGKHEVDKYGTYIVADMIDNKSSRKFAPADTRGVWMTIHIPKEAGADQMINFCYT